jgi:8-oxo-dGTP diphosphatase
VGVKVGDLIMGITLLYGTRNVGKLNAMCKHLALLDINIIGLNDVDISLPSIYENGNIPLENAKIKALAYYKATGMPVFSCDSGLYIKNAPDELQPGVHVRNINGKYLSDEEMIEHYGKLAESFGGHMTVRYKNGICLVIGDEVYEYMSDDIAGEEFIIASKPHPRRTLGFPLDSLSVHIRTGKYYYDMDELKDRSSMDEGFRNFFKRVLNLEERG